MAWADSPNYTSGTTQASTWTSTTYVTSDTYPTYTHTTGHYIPPGKPYIWQKLQGLYISEYLPFHLPGQPRNCQVLVKQ